MLRYYSSETYCLNSGVQLIMSTVMNTNFLRDGAFLQSSDGRFFVFSDLLDVYSSWNSIPPEAIKEQPILYRPSFWRFIEEKASDPQYFTYENVYCLNHSQFIDFLKNIAPNVSKEEINDKKVEWNNQDSKGFKEQFDWIQQQIALGAFEKALPITLQQGAGKISESFLRDTILSMIEASRNNYSYGFWSERSGIIGSTPEILLNWRQDAAELATMALAGTWKKNNHSMPDFTDFKIRQEHNFVISDILNQLSYLKIKQCGSTDIVELPYLYHLKTNIILNCKTFLDALGALEKLHPTAALGVYPRSKEFFSRLSDFKLQKIRQGFGAPICFISQREIFSLVAIRNIIWNKNENLDDIYLFAGCGVTASSQFDIEWQEVLDKQSSVKKMLGLNLL